MKHSCVIPVVVCALNGLLYGSPPPKSPAPAPIGTVPVHMVVTAEARRGNDVPAISREDVIVNLGKDRAPVTDWFPYQGDRAGLELFVLLDDATYTALGAQLEDLRKFILSQPSTIPVSLAYMRDGTVDIAQNLTTEHAAAHMILPLTLRTLRVIPIHYLSIGDLIKRWP